MGFEELNLMGVCEGKICEAQRAAYLTYEKL